MVLLRPYGTAGRQRHPAVQPQLGAFDELLPQETVVYFDEEEDLIAKIREFHADDAKRQPGPVPHRFFHQEMNSTLYAQYIAEASTLTPFSHDYCWAQDINLDGSLK